MHNKVPGLRWITLLLTVLLIQGCGYHLRQSAELPPSTSPIMLNGVSTNTGLGRELLYRLQSDTVEVTTSRSKAKTMLRVSSYKRQERTLSVDKSGKVAQSELRHSLNFDLIAASGRVLVPNQNIVVVRNFINTDEQKLGKTTEASQLAEGMEQELARKIITRIKAQLK